jgi:hypothetical protein
MIKGIPYTSVNGDRKYPASREAEGFELIIGTGITEGLEVTAVPDTMNCAVGVGGAIIKGHRIIVDAPETVAHDLGDVTYARLDIKLWRAIITPT